MMNIHSYSFPIAKHEIVRHGVLLQNFSWRCKAIEELLLITVVLPCDMQSDILAAGSIVIISHTACRKKGREECTNVPSMVQQPIAVPYNIR